MKDFERKAITDALAALDAAGWHPTHVNDGEEDEDAHDVAEVLSVIDSTDYGRVHLSNPGASGNGKRPIPVAWFLVVLGNDEGETIADYGLRPGFTEIMESLTTVR